jgi:hypothetical protein
MQCLMTQYVIPSTLAASLPCIYIKYMELYTHIAFTFFPKIFEKLMYNRLIPYISRSRVVQDWFQGENINSDSNTVFS